MGPRVPGQGAGGRGGRARGVAGAGRPLRRAAGGVDRPRAASGSPAQRAAAWTRAARTNALPDRWIALGYRDNERRFAVLGKPIPDVLAVGPDPAAAGDPAAPLGAEAQWLVDFDRAVDRGMAFRIPLTLADAGGFDRLLVLGVRATGDGAEGARRLTGLLDAHHYTDGLALAAPGTPTNNTDDTRSAWSAAGDDAAAWPAQRARRRADRERLGRDAAGPGARARGRSAVTRGGCRRRGDRLRAQRARRAVAGDLGLHARPAHGGGVRRRARRGAGALPRGGHRGRLAAGAAGRPAALRRAGRDVAAPLAAARPARPRRAARAAAQRARGRVAGRAWRRPADRPRHRPRHRARRRRRDGAGVDALLVAGAGAARGRRRHVRARRAGAAAAAGARARARPGARAGGVHDRAWWV